MRREPDTGTGITFIILSVIKNADYSYDYSQYFQRNLYRNNVDTYYNFMN